MAPRQVYEMRVQRVEDASARLQFAAERWTLTGRSLRDVENDRCELLKAARAYAAAVRNLARPIRPR